MENTQEDNTIIDIEQLRDVEHRILSYMIQSYNHIKEIEAQLNHNDFTFVVNSIIYQTITLGKEIFKEYSGISDIDKVINTITNILEENYNIKKSSSIKILSSLPSTHIESDINIVQNYSFEKDIDKSKKLNFIEVSIENKDSLTTGFFTDDTRYYKRFSILYPTICL